MSETHDLDQYVLNHARGVLGTAPRVIAKDVHDMGAERLQRLISDHKLTSRQLANLTPQATNSNLLTLKQNLGVLRDQATDVLKAGPRATVKALAQNVKDGVRGQAGLRSGTGAITRYMTGPGVGLALNTLPALYQAAAEEDPTGRGRSRSERMGQVAGSVVGSLAGTLPAQAAARLGMAGIPINMVTSMAGGKLGGAVGGLIGRGIGKVAPKRKRKARTEMA